MYYTLITLHSVFRWLVLLSLIYTIFRASIGYFGGAKFTKTDNTIRHWTATIAHIQLLIGMILYTQSPIIKYFWNDFKQASTSLDTVFFGLIHLILMLIAIVILTIGSALAKRQETDEQKFRTMLVWFSIALLLIFVAIPWPFSPLANRPLLRTF
ncbi:MAG: hypothetical protein MUF45_08960 [Spirosomaceae bacterium]|nr:hypothetical protein [Spirosomataceae bacterium]